MPSLRAYFLQVLRPQPFPHALSVLFSRFHCLPIVLTASRPHSAPIVLIESYSQLTGLPAVRALEGLYSGQTQYKIEQ